MRKNKLAELEKQHGSLDLLIPNIVNESGSQKAAAARLGLSQSTVGKWLSDHGYVLKLVYVRSSTNQSTETA